MQVKLRTLYQLEGETVKEKMREGKQVVISFDNMMALGESTVNDLKEFVELPNVEVVDTTWYINEQLGVEKKRSASQLELFFGR